MPEPRTNGRQTTRRVKSTLEQAGRKVANATVGVERARRWLEPTGPRRARPLFGRLPLMYLIPQDVHSVLDYIASSTCMATSVVADTARAEAAAWVIGSSYATASAMTDYRLSVAKIIPIEVHEVLDYLAGFAQISMPFLLGYWKKDRLASMIQVLNGLTVIGVSLVTDYRAARGVGGRLMRAAEEKMAEAAE